MGISQHMKSIITQNSKKSKYLCLKEHYYGAKGRNVSELNALGIKQDKNLYI